MRKIKVEIKLRGQPCYFFFVSSPFAAPEDAAGGGAVVVMNMIYGDMRGRRGVERVFFIRKINIREIFK